MHGDEAVHAVKFLDLWENGHYAYDPHEYHGPTLNDFTLPIVWLSGVHDRAELSESHLRLTTVIFGLLTVLFCAMLRDGLGTPATLVAALLLAIAPPFVFYSRYYIQETLLMCFTLAAIGCGWRWLVSRRLPWAIGCGAALGLMHATKETCVITFACMFPALLFANRGRLNLRRNAPAILAAAAAAAIVSIAFFSSFGTNWRGVLDSFAMLSVYTARACGADHIQPWWFVLPYLSLWQAPGGPPFFGGLIPLLALAGLLQLRTPQSSAGSKAAIGESTRPLPNRALVRFITGYSILLLIAYSAIPYKTPWCILQPLLGLTLLAGCGAQLALVAPAPIWQRTTTAILFTAAASLTAWQSWLAAIRLPTDQRNPFVYSHPLRDAVEIGRWLERIAAVSPAGHDLPIYVYYPNPWPLPWYLRSFTRIGYWETLPDNTRDAAVIIADTHLQERLSARLTDEYQISVYGIRPNESVAVFVHRDLYDHWKATQESAPPPRTTP